MRISIRCQEYFKACYLKGTSFPRSLRVDPPSSSTSPLSTWSIIPVIGTVLVNTPASHIFHYLNFSHNLTKFMFSAFEKELGWHGNVTPSRRVSVSAKNTFCAV